MTIPGIDRAHGLVIGPERRPSRRMGRPVSRHPARASRATRTRMGNKTLRAGSSNALIWQPVPRLSQGAHRQARLQARHRRYRPQDAAGPLCRDCATPNRRPITKSSWSGEMHRDGPQPPALRPDRARARNAVMKRPSQARPTPGHRPGQPENRASRTAASTVSTSLAPPMRDGYARSARA